MATRTLEITFIGNSQPVTKAFAEVEHASGGLKGALGKVGGAFGDMAKIAGGFVIAEGILKAPGFLMDAAKAAAEDEAAIKRLDQSLRNAGGSFDQHVEKLNARIDAGQKLVFGDDDIRDSFQALLAATGDVDEALSRQTVAMDLARGANISLEQASRLVGKVNEENVDAFRRMGIVIKDGATEAEALGAISEKFGGQAKAYGESTAGQFEQTQIAMGELKESIGTALLPVMAKIGQALVNDVIPAMQQFAAWWAANGQPKVQAFMDWILPILKSIGEFIRDEVMPVVKEQFEKFQDYYESDIKPALDNVKSAIEAVVTFLKEHWGQIEPFVRPIWIGIQTAAEVALGLVKVAIDLLGGDWKGAVEGMRDIWKTITDGFKDQFNAVKDQILVAVGLLKSGFEGIAGAIRGAFVAAINEIIGLVNQAIAAYNKIPLAPNVGQIPLIPTGGGSAAPPQIGPFQGPLPPMGPFEPGFAGGAGGGSSTELPLAAGGVPASQPITVNVQVDRQTIATAVIEPWMTEQLTTGALQHGVAG